MICVIDVKVIVVIVILVHIEIILVEDVVFTKEIILFHLFCFLYYGIWQVVVDAILWIDMIGIDCKK